MMKQALIVLPLLILAGCYEAETDLLKGNENTIALAEAVFAANDMVWYFGGTGKTIRLCGMQTKEDYDPTCAEGRDLSIERTFSGNYIVQVKTDDLYNYGIWYRSDDSDEAKTGRRCFEWLGEGLVGLDRGLLDTGSGFGREVLAIAPAAKISRSELEDIVAKYEWRYSQTKRCLGARLLIFDSAIVVEGDNRHLPRFEIN